MYHADILSGDPSVPLKRASVWAFDAEEALALFEEGFLECRILNLQSKKREYHAFVEFSDPKIPMKRISAWVYNASEAREVLSNEYPDDKIIFLHNKEDQERPRKTD